MNIMLSITAGFIGSKRRRDSRQIIPIRWRICPQVQGSDNGELALRHSQRDRTKPTTSLTAFIVSRAIFCARAAPSASTASIAAGSARSRSGN
jgi:hypothetical protein